MVSVPLSPGLLPISSYAWPFALVPVLTGNDSEKPSVLILLSTNAVLYAFAAPNFFCSVPKSTDTFSLVMLSVSNTATPYSSSFG